MAGLSAVVPVEVWGTGRGSIDVEGLLVSSIIGSIYKPTELAGLRGKKMKKVVRICSDYSGTITDGQDGFWYPL